MVGGYTMIDCGGLNMLAESSQTISGLHDKITAAIKTGKPILAFNAVWGVGKAISPIPVFVIDFDGLYICTSSTLQVRVTEEDAVTIVNMAPAEQ